LYGKQIKIKNLEALQEIIHRFGNHKYMSTDDDITTANAQKSRKREEERREYMNMAL